MGDGTGLMGEFYECEDCHEEAVFLHRFEQVEMAFCDRHSLQDLDRDLKRMRRGVVLTDHIETVLIPND